VTGARHAEARSANPTKLYQLIVLDPPWDDSEDAYGESGKGRAAANHYQTMTLAPMKVRYEKLAAAPDALIYLWTTSQYARQAMDLLEFWDFTLWRHRRLGQGDPRQGPPPSHGGGILDLGQQG
jgi:hypothetical protein